MVFGQAPLKRGRQDSPPFAIRHAELTDKWRYLRAVAFDPVDASTRRYEVAECALMTTFTDERAVIKVDIDGLYSRRWQIERKFLSSNLATTQPPPFPAPLPKGNGRKLPLPSGVGWAEGNGLMQ